VVECMENPNAKDVTYPRCIVTLDNLTSKLSRGLNEFMSQNKIPCTIYKSLAKCINHTYLIICGFKTLYVLCLILGEQKEKVHT
jgi:hypothetical protein